MKHRINQTQKLILYLTYTFLVLTCVSTAFIFFYTRAVSKDFTLLRETVENPGRDFKLYTGLDWSNTNEILEVGDTHTRFMGLGEFYLVFKTDEQTAAALMASSPHPGYSDWEQGPIPRNIGVFPTYGISRLKVESVSDDNVEYKGPAKLTQLFESEKIWYVVKSDGLYKGYQNGRLLIIDVNTNTVWFSKWDSVWDY